MNRNPESGFALLFVYAMAATVAIMLYMEIPRVAFEAQRDKEQLLIDRGEQYSRGIQLYVRKFNRYPPSFEALESTQNQRFIRHRYTDPMTGKHTEEDTWRIIHVGPGGVFTDSLLYGKKKDDKTPEKQTFITEMQQVGGNPLDPNQQVNLAERRRQSDQPGAPGDPSNPAAPPNVNQPIVDQNGQLIQAVAPGTQPPQQQVFPNVQLPPGVQMPQGIQLPPGVQLPQPVQPGQPPSAAVNMINNMLTTPRPGGFPGQPNGTPVTAVDPFGNPVPQSFPALQPGQQPGIQPGAQASLPPVTPRAPQPVQPAQNVIGGGIAGIASKVEQDGIKLYRDRKPYNEWEFVYDISKDASRPGAGGIQQAAAPGQAVNQNPANPAANPNPTANPNQILNPVPVVPGRN